MNRRASLALHFGLEWGRLEHAETEAAPILSARFASDFLTTMRPYLLFLSGITGLVGLALAPAIPATVTIALGLVFFLAYGFGQALTDCFQTDTDSISSPYRPLVTGSIRRRDVLGVSLAALLVSGAVLVALHPANLALAGLEIAGLLTYTWMKRRWWGGPPHNAWIVALLVVMGYVTASGAAGAVVVWSAHLGWAAAASFLGYAAFVVSGYHKDVEADRVTGYRTLPVRFGRRVSARVSDALSAGAVVCVAALVVSAPSFGRAAGLPAIVFLLAGAAAFVLAGTRLHRSHTDADAHPAITLVVHAYVLTLAGAAAAWRPAWTPFLALFYVAFVVSLRARPCREQI
jgi:4-hydroxybenzoate polyprenyltransferase